MIEQVPGQQELIPAKASVDAPVERTSPEGRMPVTLAKRTPATGMAIEGLAAGGGGR